MRLKGHFFVKSGEDIKAVDFGENFQAFSDSYEENNKALEKLREQSGINELSGWLYILIPEEGDEQ